MGTKRVVLIGAEETGRRALASLISAKANLIAVFTSPHDLPTYQNVYEPNRHLNRNIISIEDINNKPVIAFIDKGKPYTDKKTGAQRTPHVVKYVNKWDEGEDLTDEIPF